MPGHHTMYVGPFKVLERKGEVAYWLELPPNLSGVHGVFDVSQLKKCLRVPEEQLPMEDLEIQDDLTYTEYPAQILESAERRTRNRTVRMCKVRWNHHTQDEATWEREDQMMAEFPELFASQPWILGRDSFKGGRFVTPWILPLENFIFKTINETLCVYHDTYSWNFHMNVYLIIKYRNNIVDCIHAGAYNFLFE